MRAGSNGSCLRRILREKEHRKIRTGLGREAGPHQGCCRRESTQPDYEVQVMEVNRGFALGKNSKSWRINLAEATGNARWTARVALVLMGRAWPPLFKILTIAVLIILGMLAATLLALAKVVTWITRDDDDDDYRFGG